MTNPFRLEYRDKLGNPITVKKWSDLVEDREYRLIEQEDVGEYFISTVWLGIPHLPGDNYFETIVFKYGKSSFLMRYPTIEDAILGHKSLVEEYKEK